MGYSKGVDNEEMQLSKVSQPTNDGLKQDASTSILSDSVNSDELKQITALLSLSFNAGNFGTEQDY